MSADISRRLSRRLRNSFDIERDEARPTFLLTAHLLLGMAAVICLKAVSDSVFLSEIDARRLPYVDLAVTAGVGLAVNYYLRWTTRVRLNFLISWTLVLLSLSIGVFWLLLRADAPGVAAALYLWVGIFAVLIPSQVWSLAGAAFTTRQAKRLFSIIGSGGILGAALGGNFAGYVGPRIGTDWILPAVSVFLLGGAFLARRVSSDSPAPAAAPGAAAATARVPILESFQLVRRNRYLLLITLAIFASTIVGTLIKYQFKATAQLAFDGDRDMLTSFNGYFYGYIAVFSFLFHAVVTGRLLRWLGLSWCLFVLPFSLLVGSAGLWVFSGSLVAAILARGADQGFRHSIDRSSVELLYVPVPAALRARVKSFVDMAVSRLADGVASLVLLTLIGLGGRALEASSWVSLGLVAFWLALLAPLRREYVRTLRGTIERRDIRSEELLQKLAESEPSEELEASLRSSDPRDVEAAVGWIQFSNPRVAQAQLASLVLHPSPTVRRKAMRAVEAKDLPGCEREVLGFLVLEEGVEERWQALSYLERRGGERLRPALRDLLDDRNEELAATAAVWLLRHDEEQVREAARQRLETFFAAAAEGPPRRRVTAALLLAAAPEQHDAERLLAGLLADDNVDVVRAALRAAAEVRAPSQIPVLLELLADRRFARDARRALGAYGEAVLDDLGAALRDAGAAPALQRQAARVLGHIGGRRAARTLLAYLRRPRQAARAEVLRALGRIRAREPKTAFEREIVVLLVKQAFRRFYDLFVLSYSLEGADEEGAKFLERALEERLRHILLEIAALLALIYPQREIEDAFYRIRTGRPDLRSNALEFLDSRLLGSPLRNMLMPALETNDRERLLAAARQFFDLYPLSPTAALRRLLRLDDPWLEACACRVAADRSTLELRDIVRSLARHADPVLCEAAAEAERRLNRLETRQWKP